MPGAAFRLEADSISKAAQLFVDVPFETAKTVFVRIWSNYRLIA